MEISKMSKEMDLQAAAMEIAMFQKALEMAFRQKGVQYDSTISQIVVNYANRITFERNLSAAPETDSQEVQA